MKLGLQIFIVILGALGLITNATLLLVLWRARTRMFRLNMQLVGPLAVVDFSQSLLIVIQTLVAMVITREGMLQSSWFCSCFGVPRLVLLCVSIILLSAIAMDRYYLVVHENGINCWLGWIAVVVVSGSITGLVLASHIIYGSQVDGSLGYCRSKDTEILAKAVRCTSSTIVALGLVIVVFCYIGVYRRCRANLSFLKTLSTRYTLLIAAYVICWLPKSITSTYSLFASPDSLPEILRIIGPLGLILLLSVNPCLVIGFQANLRSKLPSFSSNRHSSTDQEYPSQVSLRRISIQPSTE
ncbi:hypothetical protein DSO57_1024575 [Entomophthora muscae]|uniref:Uncharacterized protein n=1 Tax=Entomophthora muscae TaxID=34485 RepID=A0ACC2RTP3_9FUNG|nr:hypothetical protein DSO57_1024575 [Entomophthora muscae]